MRRYLLLAFPFLALVLAQSCGSSSPGSGFTDPDSGQSSGSSGGGDGAACSSPRRTCNGVCIDVTTDPQNCGNCGSTCDTGAQCCGGVCVTTAACDFSVTKVDTFRLYLSGSQWVTIHGAGFAPGMKVLIGDGRAPARVIDDKTALLLTPPGLAGSADLSVEVNGKTATLKQAFQYIDAGLATPWQQKPMSIVRGEDPGIAVMQDGRVLIAGGTEVPDDPAALPDGGVNHALDTAEIYTRQTDVVTPVASTMSAPRWHDSAITLLSGKVLVVGATCPATPCDSAKNADLFDPTTNTFTPTKGSLTNIRTYTRSVLLPDGRVLVASASDPTLEVYDPATDAFTEIGQTPVVHTFGFMVRLRDGRALIGGGDGTVTDAEIFDPETNAVTPTGPLQQGRSMLTAHTLPDGRVLVIGGASISAGGIDVPLDSIEAFDPKAGTFSTMPYKLSIGRTWHASALVRDGTVLVMGGYTIDKQCNSLTDSVDQIQPLANKVAPFANLPNANTEWTAVTLLDGSVLGVGGGACGTATALPDLDFLPGAPETK